MNRMKSMLTCKDMGIETCSFEVRSEDREEIKHALYLHATKYHAEVVSGLTEIEKLEMSRAMDVKMR
jgi:predicted small metal-binding protein